MKWFLALLFVATVFGDLYDDPNYDPLEDCTVTTNKQLCEDFLRRRYGNSRAPPTSATTRSYKEAQLINAKERKPEPEVNRKSWRYVNTGAPTSATTRSYKGEHSQQHGYKDNTTPKESPLELITGKHNKEFRDSCAYLPFASSDDIYCPHGWTLSPETNYCYKAIGLRLFDDAERACKKVHSLLTVPHSDEENHFISWLAEEDAWLGMHFDHDFFNVKTSDGCAFNYNNLDTTSINTKCFEPFMDKHGKWTLSPCKAVGLEKKMTVCKRVPFSTGSSVTCPRAPKKDRFHQVKCREGWTEFQSYCYKTIREPHFYRLNFRDAVADEPCTSVGGRLASVHSKEENDFVVSLAKQVDSNKNMFLGGGYSYKHKKFFWSDGCPWEFTNWAPNRPSHKDNLENCIEVR
ncbi:hypothetical protein QR680_008175 [Steinernema hermaphroditum]|uniref:C-type lectin domain-containing protein n=1 Tax=Steinernema hermaphroditum TaxID=289476 RepID=A0AA39M773_9BILA|nr:hypothetical protein QR680_008175 [Steinernema hermaphroditum]